MTQNASAPSPTPPSQPAGTPAPGGPLGKEEKTFGMLCHLLALSGLVVPVGFIIGPLVIWLMKKDQYPFVNEQGKESLNWQLTMLIGFIICFVLCFVLIGFVLLPLLGLVDLIFVILASIKANDGISYKYPFRIQFIK